MRSVWAKAVVLGVTAVAATPVAFGWGDEGHRLVALVADARLTPEAKAGVHALLGNQTLADVAPYADEYRQSHAYTAPWHYTDIPLDAKTYVRDRDCPDNNNPDEPKDGPWRDCATDRIPYFIARLKNPALSADDRKLALEMVVHFVGDLHQPLHAIGDARGGNSIAVTFLGSEQCGERNRCNLHGVWDYSMIDRRHLSEPKYDALLESEISEHHWDQVSQENPKVWAEQSHQLAVEAWVPNNVGLGRDYYETEIQVVDRQLAVAGIRLARILNGVFRQPVVAPPAPVTQP